MLNTMPRSDGRQILIMPTMHIRPIRTDKEHRNALAEIEKLWSAPIGSIFLRRWCGAEVSQGDLYKTNPISLLG